MRLHTNTLTEDEIHAALKAARQIDPDADHADGAPDCLLIASEHADEVLALFPGAWRDDNDPPTSWTRIVLPFGTV